MSIYMPESRSLFVRQDEDLSSIVPKFTASQIGNMMMIGQENYNIPLGMGGTGTRYCVKFPNGMTAHVSRAGDDPHFYGNAHELIEEYKKKNPTSDVTQWINDNARDLNIAQHYWDALNMRKKAESLLLKANLKACEAKAYAAGKWGLNEQERKLLIAEFGYLPEEL